MTPALHPPALTTVRVWTIECLLDKKKKRFAPCHIEEVAMKRIHRVVVFLVLLAAGLAVGAGVLSSISPAPAVAGCYGCWAEADTHIFSAFNRRAAGRPPRSAA